MHMKKIALMGAAGALGLFAIWWFSPKAAVFVWTALPLVVSGVNLMLCMAYLTCLGKDELVSGFLTLGGTIFVLAITSFGIHRMWEYLYAIALPGTEERTMAGIIAGAIGSGIVLGYFTMDREGVRGKEPPEPPIY